MTDDNLFSLDDIMSAPSVEAPNVIPFELEQVRVAIAVPAPTPAPSPEEAYPWSPEEDEMFRRGSFKRSWKEMPSRRDWNADPIHKDGIICHLCGYKWHRCDIIIDSDGWCFNCWMIETKPGEVSRFWRNMSVSSGERHGETAPPPILKKLGEKKEK